MPGTGYKMEKIRILCLTIKYFAQGQDWTSANEYAKFIVEGFKK